MAEIEHEQEPELAGLIEDAGDKECEEPLPCERADKIGQASSRPLAGCRARKVPN
jgi:hypothetical protein